MVSRKFKPSSDIFEQFFKFGYNQTDASTNRDYKQHSFCATIDSKIFVVTLNHGDFSPKFSILEWNRIKVISTGLNSNKGLWLAKILSREATTERSSQQLWHLRTEQDWNIAIRNINKSRNFLKLMIAKNR